MDGQQVVELDERDVPGAKLDKPANDSKTYFDRAYYFYQSLHK